MTEGSFDSLLMDSIDEAFSTLGDSAKQSIYFHLRTKFGIDKKDIPKHVDRFENGLEKIFGAGSRFLEIIIMKKLYEKIHNPLELNETNKLMFADYVASARKGFKTSRQ